MDSIHSTKFSCLNAPNNVLIAVMAQKLGNLNSSSSTRVVATSASEKGYDALYYTKAALAGGICAGLTHASLT